MGFMREMVKRLVPEWMMEKERWLRQQRNISLIKGIRIEKPELNRFQEGINLIGPLEDPSGLGQSSRLLERELKSSGIPYMTVTYPLKENKENLPERLMYGINLFHINPHELLKVYSAMGKACWDRHYNIAFWLWELEDFPDEWVSYTRFFQEIWTPSEFVSKSIRQKTEIPVKTIPYWLTAESDERLSRADFGLPEDIFLFLMAFDRNSIAERKNPRAVIEAYRQAFQAGDPGVGLAVKVSHAARADFNEVKAQLEGYNVYLFDEIMSAEKKNRLIQLSDVYVSLHRSEGFGLMMAEAMLLGTPVIATNYSANTEFMGEDAACMVDYRLKKLTKSVWPYKEGNVWAEADITQAAGFMKRLFEDRGFYMDKKNRGRARIQEKLGVQEAVRRIQERMDEIYSKRLPEQG